MNHDTPLYHIINRIILNRLKVFNTFSLGKIVYYNPTTFAANIQLLTNKIHQLDNKQNFIVDDQPCKVLYEVPVLPLRASNHVVTLPLKKGDECIVLFCHDNEQNSLNTGEISKAIEKNEEEYSVNNSMIALPFCFSVPKLDTIINPYPDVYQIRREENNNSFIEYHANTDKTTIKGSDITHEIIEPEKISTLVGNASIVTQPQQTETKVVAKDEEDNETGHSSTHATADTITRIVRNENNQSSTIESTVNHIKQTVQADENQSSSEITPTSITLNTATNTVNANQTITLNAEQSITLNVNGTSIVINGNSVTITGSNEVTVNAPTINLNGQINCNGNVTATGNMNVNGAATIGGIDFASHTHMYILPLEPAGEGPTGGAI